MFPRFLEINTWGAGLHIHIDEISHDDDFVRRQLFCRDTGCAFDPRTNQRIQNAMGIIGRRFNQESTSTVVRATPCAIAAIPPMMMSFARCAFKNENTS